MRGILKEVLKSWKSSLIVLEKHAQHLNRVNLMIMTCILSTQKIDNEKQHYLQRVHFLFKQIMAKCNNSSDIKCHSSYYKSTCFIWKNFSATIWVQLQPFLSNHIFCKFTKKYTFIKLKTPWLRNNKMQLIIMDVIQSYYTLSNKNNRTELMFSLILIYGAWLISFLWFLIKAY